jgi:hypothetical protein
VVVVAVGWGVVNVAVNKLGSIKLGMGVDGGTAVVVVVGGRVVVIPG